jgi:hypothetical protein
MNTREHILILLREEFKQWEELLASFSEAEITTSRPPSALSIKDEAAHLWAWQQVSIARLEAALGGGEPHLPRWFVEFDSDNEDPPDRTNRWIYETYRNRSWSSVYQAWRDGFLRFLELGEALPEEGLMDPGRYPWLHGYPLYAVLEGSYEHHAEHFEQLVV